MAATYEVQHLRDGLLIKVRRQRPWTRSLFAAAVTGSVALLTLFHFVAGPILALVVFLAVLLGILEGVSQARAELRVTALEFQTRGKVGLHSSVSTVCSANIRWLEYRPDSSDLDIGYRPGGLHAKLRFATVCVLPLLDEKQTLEIIESIAKRFPEMAKQWSEPSLGDGFVTLGLAEKARK
jgi:hypothetical protein